MKNTTRGKNTSNGNNSDNNRNKSISSNKIKVKLLLIKAAKTTKLIPAQNNHHYFQ